MVGAVGKLAEIVSLELDLLDALPEFPNLGLFRIVGQNVMRRRIVEIHLTDERMLRIVEVPALGLNHPSGFARIFFLPFCHNVVVGLDFEQALKDQRKALRGGFFERQNPHIIVVETEVPPVAFEM